MATFLDLGLLKNFAAVFTFLLVFAIVYGLLGFSKIFGENKGLYGVIAFAVAVLTLFSPTAVGMVSNMAPWFTVLFIFIIFLLIAYQLFGITNNDITATIKATSGIKWAIFIVGFIIMIYAASTAFGPGLLATPSSGELANVTTSAGSGDFNQNVRTTMFHPKIVGLIFILLVGAAAVGLLGGKMKA